jgi:membrane fusion protein, heavy metal efflux system
MADTTRIHALARLSPLRRWAPALALTALTAALLHALWTPTAVQAQSAAAPRLAQGTGSTGTATMPGAAAGGSGGTAGPASRSARSTTVGCLIGPERVADIGSPVTGVIASVKVDRGDAVKKGEPLIVLDSAIEQAGVQAAQARSVIDADVKAAEANLALMQQKHQRLAGLVAEGFVTPQAVEQARAERDVAEQKLAQARGQRVVQAQELGVVRAQLGQRTLRSPFNGVIAERYVNAGERAEDKPLLRVAMLDPLRVELVVPASRWGSVAKGDKLPIVPELPGASALLARVTHIDRMIDAGSNTFRVRLSLPNPGHKLPAGARCKLDAPVAATPPAAAASEPALMPTAQRRAPESAASGTRPRLKITI